VACSTVLHCQRRLTLLIALHDAMTDFLDSPDWDALITGMARDLALVRPDDREAWLRDFRQGVGSDLPLELFDDLVARTEARVAEIGTGAAPTVH
jgi:hypothetical protein